MSADTALIVIDVQESFRHRAYWNEEQAQPFIANIQRLINGAKSKGLPVVRIFHVDGDGPFAMESGFIKPLAPVSFIHDAVFNKSRHSALIGSGLDVWLTENGIRKVLICGIRTEQCCETTARHASDSGYEVDYVSEATLTFAMTNAEGRTFSADEIKARTELVLAGRFARIVTVDEALSGIERAMAA